MMNVSMKPARRPLFAGNHSQFLQPFQRRGPEGQDSQKATLKASFPRFGAVKAYVPPEAEKLDEHLTLRYANYVRWDGPHNDPVGWNGIHGWGPSQELVPMDAFTWQLPKGKWPGKVVPYKAKVHYRKGKAPEVVYNSAEAPKIHSFRIDLREHPDFKDYWRPAYVNDVANGDRYDSVRSYVVINQYREPLLIETPIMKWRMRHSESYRLQIADLRQEIRNDIIRQIRQKTIEHAQSLLKRNLALKPPRTPEKSARTFEKDAQPEESIQWVENAFRAILGPDYKQPERPTASSQGSDTEASGEDQSFVRPDRRPGRRAQVPSSSSGHSAAPGNSAAQRATQAGARFITFHT